MDRRGVVREMCWRGMSGAMRWKFVMGKKSKCEVRSWLL
jgi:hypothetical protein